MPKPLRKWGLLAGAAALFVLLAVFVATGIKHRREVDSVPDEQKIARTLEIVRTGTPGNRNVLKVLFYGQSITASGWDKAVSEHWRERYPNTDFVVENRAIGGFWSDSLVRTTEQDITAFYPDLIVFHVYGDHRTYERILRLFRSLTAADIIVQTDHGEVLPDPFCAEGLRTSLHLPPGCAGTIWLHQRIWEDEMSYHKIPELGKKYGVAVEPQRTWWREYLLQTHTDPGAMLIDPIHPNQRGKHLIAALFNRYFDGMVDRWNGQTSDHIVSLPYAVPVQFNGSRIELITDKPLGTLPSASVDGVLPGDLDGCYQVTRANSIVTAPDWPAVRRITLLHDHVAEDWTATLTGISDDQRSFRFDVRGSVSGNQGSGDAAHDFQSTSGLLRIEAQDWMPYRAFEGTHTPLPMPFEVRWSVKYVCAEPETIARTDGTVQYRYVLATGLANNPHTVEFNTPLPPQNVKEFRAYKPPLIEK